ncbi:MAG: tRNA pseudouridine(55) synthase TruB [Candidatus Margulisiibacteriota bacterium]
MNGFLLVDKPSGITSYDVIRQLKKYLPPKTKIGHSGTLDPFATGLLIIAIGKQYTKQLSQLLNLDKTYQAEITLGTSTDSYDIDGNKTFQHPTPFEINIEELNHCIDSFKGEIEQYPPKFSAKKIKGVPAYKRARNGELVELKPNKVTIYELSLNNYDAQQQQINCSVHCSKGTYIRSLAHDIGEKLNVGGYLSKLNRLAIGNHSINEATPLDEIKSDSIENLLVSSLNI